MGYKSKSSNQKTSNTKRRNPLAHSRGSQKAPENLWFKRSGAGYQLFVEYYVNQPLGSISVGEKNDVRSVAEKRASTNDDDEGVDFGMNDTTMKGMSRAAKRRRKRKGTTPTISSQTQDNLKKRKETEHQQATIGTENQILVNSKLLNAVRTASNLMPCHMPFFQTMSRPLPTTFRIRKSADENNREDFCRELASFDDIVSHVDLGPDIFQCSISKKDLPSKLKELLMQFSQNGTIARQELGSMLPVLALPLEEGDCVVDMCASPGSKTLQALECIGPKGLVLANDILESRLTALKAAVERSGVPKISRIQYSHVDATKLKLSAACDAVICDVPCSGDGTVRKDPHVLPMWKPLSGNTLHATQLSILKRSLELVKVGGHVCYSTCSLNPVEDEAVVAAALHSFDDKIELVEIRNLANASAWVHRPGVKTWNVAQYIDQETGDLEHVDKEEEASRLVWYPTFDDAKGRMQEASKTMWSHYDKDFPLERCARLLPQDHDSGGFFLALFKKKA